jgi:hypothetical protein
MTTIKAMRLASVITASNVLGASGFSIVGIIRPQYLVPVESVPTEPSLLLAMYATPRYFQVSPSCVVKLMQRVTPLESTREPFRQRVPPVRRTAQACRR